DDALRAVMCRGLTDQFRVRHGGAVHRHLVRAGIEQTLDIPDLADAPAHGQRNEDFACDRFYDGQNEVAVISRGRDVEEGEFVGTLLVVATRDFDGITGVDQVDEVDALHDPSGGDIEAGNDAAAEIAAGRFGCGGHAAPSSSARCCAAAKSSVPS